jgi:hypothetical protein
MIFYRQVIIQSFIIISFTTKNLNDQISKFVRPELKFILTTVINFFALSVKKFEKSNLSNSSSDGVVISLCPGCIALRIQTH